MKILLYVCLFFFCCTTPAFAQVKLNEVMVAPSSGSEWIELINIGTASAELSGWQVWDELTTPSLLYTFPTGTYLAPATLLIFEVNNKLNNAGDAISLLNAQNQLQERFTYSSSSSQVSWGKYPDGTGEWHMLQTSSRGTANVENPVSALIPTPSPQVSPGPTPSVSPSPFPSSLIPPILNEFQACPSSGDTEWVELRNPNTQAVTLTNWQLVDATGNIRLITISLPASGQAAVNLTSSMLNNTGDSLILQTPEDTSVDQTSYTSCEAEATWQLIQGGWMQLPPTKGQPNVFPTPATASGSISTDTVHTPSESTFFADNTEDTFSTSQELSILSWPDIDYAKPLEAEQTLSSGNIPDIPKPNFSLIIFSILSELTGISLQLPTVRRWYTDWRARQKNDFFSDGFS